MKQLGLLLTFVSLACAAENENSNLIKSTLDGQPPFYLLDSEKSEFQKFKASNPCVNAEYFRYRSDLKVKFYAVPKSIKFDHLLISRNPKLDPFKIYSLINSLCYIEDGSGIKMNYKKDTNSFTFKTRLTLMPKSYKNGSCAKGNHPNFYFTNLGDTTLADARMKPWVVNLCEKHMGDGKVSVDKKPVTLDYERKYVRESTQLCHFRGIDRVHNLNFDYLAVVQEEYFVPQKKHPIAYNQVVLLHSQYKRPESVIVSPVLSSFYKVKRDFRYGQASFRIHPDVIGLYDGAKVFTAGIMQKVYDIEFIRYNSVGYLPKYGFGEEINDQNAFDVLFIESNSLSDDFEDTTSFRDLVSDVVYPSSSYAYIMMDKSGYNVRKAIISKPGFFCYSYKPFLLGTVEERTELFKSMLARIQYKNVMFTPHLTQDNFYSCKNLVDNNDSDFNSVYINSLKSLRLMPLIKIEPDTPRFDLGLASKTNFDYMLNSPNTKDIFECLSIALIDKARYPFPKEHQCAKYKLNDFIVLFLAKYNLIISQDINKAYFDFLTKFIEGNTLLQSAMQMFSLCKDNASKEIYRLYTLFVQSQLKMTQLTDPFTAQLLFSAFSVVQGDSLLKSFKKFIKSLKADGSILEKQTCISKEYFKFIFVHPVELLNNIVSLSINPLKTTNNDPIILSMDAKQYKKSLNAEIFGSASIMYLKTAPTDKGEYPLYNVAFQNEESDNCNLIVKDLYNKARQTITSNDVSMFKNITPVTSYVSPPTLLPLEEVPPLAMPIDYVMPALENY